MSGYVDAGYAVVLVTVAGYATWVLRREKKLGSAPSRRRDR